MKGLLFVTGNKRKVWQAETTLKPFGIEIEAKDLTIPEIQSHDPVEIASTKAASAHKLTKEPVVICDHFWVVPALNGFPGGYMKDMNRWLTTNDWLALMKHKADKSVSLIELVVYRDEKTTHVFKAEFPAHFIDTPRGEGDNPAENIIVYDGQNQTIAERVDKGEHARDMSQSAWQKFGEWYAKKK